jgi:glycine cleavage system H lipoate-binding protein
MAEQKKDRKSVVTVRLSPEAANALNRLVGEQMVKTGKKVSASDVLMAILKS